MVWAQLSTVSVVSVVSLLAYLSTSTAQSLSTNTPVPPLQWLELTSLLSGTAPTGLKDASIGYDEVSRTLIIFGGESNGFPQQQTYLLNLDTLQWFSPNPPTGLSTPPPPRSAAISGGDFAASYRQGHVVIGGKGSNGSGLQDAWEFDYTNHFWSQISISPGGPSARWGSTGGPDFTAAAIQELTFPGPNNTFYLAGGFDGTNPLPLSDVWQFDIAGVLSSNDPAVLGSWKPFTGQKTLPSKVRQAGAVMPSASIVASGGCNVSDFDDNSCAQQDSYVIDTGSSNEISSAGCPAPRVGAVLVPNRNNLSTSFASQAFMMLGTFNSSLWDDGDGLNRGEVDVLNAETGVWTRIIPSGDPSSGVPVPRESAAALSYPLALVGGARSSSSDTIVFGGKDVNGNYLQDIWLLRAYLGTITATNQTWSGFGNGQLQSGVNATGTGVKIQYLTSCASAISQPTRTGTSSSTSKTKSASPTGSNVPTPSSTTTPEERLSSFNTSTSHKLLSPLSVALLLTAVVCFRLSSPSLTEAGRRTSLLWTSVLVSVVAYGLGIVGMAMSFTSITSTSINDLVKRSTSSSNLLKTGHGKAGLAFFVVLYGLVPFLCTILWCSHKDSSQAFTANEDLVNDTRMNNSNAIGFVMGEKHGTPSEAMRRAASPSQSSMGLSTTVSTSVEPRKRTQSWGGLHLWPGYRAREPFVRRSSDSGVESTSSADAPRNFEVLNRNTRARRTSAINMYGHDAAHSNPPTLPRSLSDFNWLDRRRSLNAVGELDYVMSQLHRPAQLQPETPGVEVQSTAPLMAASPFPVLKPELPSTSQCFVHLIMHISILGICAVSLVELWSRAPKATFIVFLLWTLAFYSTLFALAWFGRPRQSMLTVMLSRFHTGSSPPPPTVTATVTPPPSRPLSVALDAMPTDSRSPYTFHQPLYRRAVSSNHEDDSSNTHVFPPSGEIEDEDEDEETQQRRIEQEMDRRDVSIVTVPKRKLWIANPTLAH